jgi:TRAP-type mannitol/chloroaromatic compound transport system substrate-binding protein
MPLFDKKTDPKPNSTQPLTDQPKPTSLLNTIGQLLPLAPFVFEQMTGQKVPQMTGTVAEIQSTLTHIQTALQTVVQNQRELAQRLVNLETTAQAQLTNLTQQFQSFRLTHTREKKEIEYNPHPLTEENN